MKILMYHRNLPPDSYTGVAIQVHHLGNYLASRGNEVTIFTFTQMAVKNGYKIHTLSLPKIFQIFPRFKEAFKRILIPLYIRSVIVKSDPYFDVYHIHGDGAFIGYKHKYLRTFYGSALREMQYSRTAKGKIAQFISFQMEKMENRKLLKQGRACGISKDTAACLSSITIITPCMLAPEFSKNTDIQKSRAPSLLLVGSLGGRKQGELGLKLFYQLRELKPDVSFTMVCKNIEFHKKFWAKNYTKKYTPIFLENINQDSLIKEYNKSWLFLNFSSYEGFGVGVIEAMSQGCVVISTNNAGSRDIVKSGQNGIICKEEYFLKTMLNLIDNSVERSKLSEAAIETAKSFSAEVIGKQYLKLYSEENT